MTEYTDHRTPEGLRVRGTILVVPGRGESRATYARLGRRLAADAYRVRVLDAPDPAGAADDPAGWLARFGAALDRAAEDTADGDGVVRPVVVVGADTGAVAIAALLGGAADGGGRTPDAVVLAGLPAPDAPVPAGDDWEGELDVRTACPVHRGVLTDDALVRRGSLREAVPASLLTAACTGTIGVPALFLAGEADPLADLDAMAAAVKGLTRARLSVVREARHDVLNDLQHRSVAAEIVTFLEALRTALVPAVAVRSSSW
ncbi:alpha/beta hydrolase [uncultured Streptomyces sp.]|uniref:alpha/beta hydrolase n=1 Tax=uncultured Streptomyces sp. TaxID=174707 RepID=UPI002626AE59|nr:alpha/beta hydrolase [uncultured Streptomyces sp.]